MTVHLVLKDGETLRSKARQRMTLQPAAIGHGEQSAICYQSHHVVGSYYKALYRNYR